MAAVQKSGPGALGEARGGRLGVRCPIRRTTNADRLPIFPDYCGAVSANELTGSGRASSLRSLPIQIDTLASIARPLAGLFLASSEPSRCRRRYSWCAPWPYSVGDRLPPAQGALPRISLTCTCYLDRPRANGERWIHEVKFDAYWSTSLTMRRLHPTHQRLDQPLPEDRNDARHISADLDRNH